MVLVESIFGFAVKRNAGISTTYFHCAGDFKLGIEVLHH